MATYFSLRDGLLTDTSTYALSLSSAEKTNNTSSYMLLTTDSWSTPYEITEYNSIDSIAIQLSSRSATPVGRLNVQANVYDSVSGGNLTKTGVVTSSITPFGAGTDGSVYLSGASTSIITIPYSDDINLGGTTPFTIEHWQYTVGNYSNYRTIFCKRVNGGVSTSFEAYMNVTDGKLRFYNGGEIATNYVVPLNTWVHFAYVYTGTTLSIYANGVSAGGGNFAITNNTEPLVIGGKRGYTTPFDGYISNFRITKGIALYTANFTPPTAPLRVNANTTLLYKSPYGNTYDESGATTINIGTYPISSFNYDIFDPFTGLVFRNWYNLKLSNSILLTNSPSFKINLKTDNSNQLSVMGVSTLSGIDYDRMFLRDLYTQNSNSNFVLSSNIPITLSSASPFGEGIDQSIVMDGTVNLANTIALSSSNYLDFTKSDFTVEGWYNFYVSGGACMFNYGNVDVGNNGFTVLNRGEANNFIYANIANEFGTSSTIIRSSIVPQLNRWYHIALVRYRGVIRLYIDGVSVGTPYNIGFQSIYVAPNFHLRFGSFNGTNSKFNGLLSNIRATKYARYTKNFTVPTAPFTDNDYSITLTSPYTLPYYKTVTNTIDTLSIKGSDDLYLGGILSGTSVLTTSITADYLNTIPAPDTEHTITALSVPLKNLSISKSSLIFPTLSTNTTLSLYGSSGLVVGYEGTLQIGTSSNPISENTNHQIALSGTLNVLEGGTFNIYGSYKTPSTKLISYTPSNSNSFTVSDDVSSNWKVNDTLIFTPNTAQTTSYDEEVLVSFSGSNIFNTTTPTSFNHSVLSNIPNVVNLTRNVKINGLSNSAKGTINIANKLKNTYINNAEFKLLNDLFIVDGDNSSSVTISGCSFTGTSNELYVFSTQYRNHATCFNGAPSILAAPNNSSYHLTPTSVFTSEMYINFNSIGPRQRFFTVGKPDFQFRTNISFETGYLNTNRIYFEYFYGGTNITQIFFDNITLVTNTWYHIAFVVNNGSVRLYVDGVLRGSSTSINQTTNFDSGHQLYLSNISDLSGCISNFHFNKSNIYPNEFTPSYRRIFPNLSTVLLTCQDDFPKDNSFNNYIVTATSVTYTSNISTFYIPTKTYNNINTANNNIFYKLKYGLYLDNNNFKNTSNNLVLNCLSGGIFTRNLSGSYEVDNNTIVGPSRFGFYSIDNKININNETTYNCTYGTYIGGNNVGIFSNISNTYSNTANVYVDASTSNVSSTFLRNITASNGKSLGFVVSGNNNNPLTPVILNVNNLLANDNTNGGFEGYSITGNLTALELNRNGFYGMKTSIGNGPTTIDGITALMNNVATASAGIGILSGYNFHPTIIRNANVGKIVGSSTFGSGIILDSTKFSQFSVYNSTVSGGTNDFRLLTTRNILQGSYLISNTKVGNLPIGAGISTLNYQPDVIKNTGFAFTNMNNASGYNVTYLAAGTRQIDSTVNITVGTAPSERLTPQSRTFKLRSGSKFVALNSGQSTAISVYVRKSTVESNGVAYNGNSPRLILKRNSAAGINSDILMDQLDTTSENFLKLSGVTPEVTDDCVLEFYVDCDGTLGFINIDNWTAN
jgi:hypothetical protein